MDDLVGALRRGFDIADCVADRLGLDARIISSALAGVCRGSPSKRSGAISSPRRVRDRRLDLFAGRAGPSRLVITVDVVVVSATCRSDLADVLDHLVGVRVTRSILPIVVAQRLGVDAVDDLVDLGQRLPRAVRQLGDRGQRAVDVGDDAVDLLARLAEVGGERLDIVDDLRDLVLVDRLEQAFGGVQRRLELVGGAGQLSRSFATLARNLSTPAELSASACGEFLRRC